MQSISYINWKGFFYFIHKSFFKCVSDRFHPTSKFSFYSLFGIKRRFLISIISCDGIRGVFFFFFLSFLRLLLRNSINNSSRVTYLYDLRIGFVYYWLLLVDNQRWWNLLLCFLISANFFNLILLFKIPPLFFDFIPFIFSSREFLILKIVKC